MAVTTSSRSTLNIQFHTQDGTTTGGSYTWKLNFPLGGTSSTLTLANVKEAFGWDSSNNDWDPNSELFLGGDCKTPIFTKENYKIDGIDAASIVTTTTTKNELS